MCLLSHLNQILQFNYSVSGEVNLQTHLLSTSNFVSQLALNLFGHCYLQLHFIPLLIAGTKLLLCCAQIY